MSGSTACPAFFDAGDSSSEGTCSDCLSYWLAGCCWDPQCLCLPLRFRGLTCPTPVIEHGCFPTVGSLFDSVDRPIQKCVRVGLWHPRNGPILLRDQTLSYCYGPVAMAGVLRPRLSAEIGPSGSLCPIPPLSRVPLEAQGLRFVCSVAVAPARDFGNWDRDTVELLTVAEAARRLGYQSRSQLYRWLEMGALTDYERTAAGGRRALVWQPSGMPSLREAVDALVRPRADRETGGDAVPFTDADLEAWSAWFDANEPAMAAELDRMLEATEREMASWGDPSAWL